MPIIRTTDGMRFVENDSSAAEESRIVRGLIISDIVCMEIDPHFRDEYFVNEYLKKLAKWSISFYRRHNKAPFMHINDIFIDKRPKLSETEIELIDELLSVLSKQYDKEHLNVDYIVRSAEIYFRKRELDITTRNIEVLSSQGDIESAEREIIRFNRVSMRLDESIYIDPGDAETIERIYRKRDERQANFFKFSGDIGLFLGNHKPGDVVTIVGPAKRGKSFLLGEYLKHATTSRIKVLKWSIEMTDTEELERTHKLFFPMIAGESRILQFPVFDCQHNQDGTCPDRESRVILDFSGFIAGETPHPTHPDHKICTKCKDNELEWERYKASLYYISKKRLDNSIHTVRSKIVAYRQLMRKYLRLVVRPKYSLTYDLMMRDIEKMESGYGFIPQMLIIDYIDIIGVDSEHSDYRLEDERWKMLQKIAGETNCLVVTATQANKEGAKANTLHSVDQAGFYGKSRHVNMMITINQTATEKAMGLWRLGISDSRSGSQNYNDMCHVLQDLKTGQMNLESYWRGKFRQF